MDKRVIVLTAALPDGTDLTVDYDGRTYNAYRAGELVAEGFTAQLEEGHPDPDLTPPGTQGPHWRFSVPGLGRVGLTRTQAAKWLDVYQRLHITQADRTPRRVGRPAIDSQGTKEISVTLPQHVVDRLEAWGRGSRRRRGAVARDMLLAAVDHRSIQGITAKLTDTPDWQGRAIEAWLEAAADQGYGFFVVRAMMNQTDEIAFVRRDNWDHSDDPTMGGREYVLTVAWPDDVDPADYGKGTADITVGAAEPRRKVTYLRSSHVAPPSLEAQRAAAHKAARDRGFKVLDSAPESSRLYDLVMVSTDGYTAEKKQDLLARLDGHNVTLTYANGESYTGHLVASSNGEFILERHEKQAHLLVRSDDAITSVADLDRES